MDGQLQRLIWWHWVLPVRDWSDIFYSLQKKQSVWKMKETHIFKRKNMKRQWWHTQKVWRRTGKTRSTTLFYSPIELLHNIISVWVFVWHFFLSYMAFSYVVHLKCWWMTIGKCVIVFQEIMSYVFYLTGNMRSALKDSCAALKIKPDHLKALIRGLSYSNCFCLLTNNNSTCWRVHYYNFQLVVKAH